MPHSKYFRGSRSAYAATGSNAEDFEDERTAVLSMPQPDPETRLRLAAVQSILLL